MKYVIALLAVIASVLVSAAPAVATPAPKVVVCKYVGQPGVDERLQTGNNPIVVSGNALPGWDGVTFPFEFADAQGKSVAIRVAVDSHDGDISECPAPVGPPDCEEEGTCPPPPPVDVCPNIEGDQETVPEGYVLEDGQCVKINPPPPPCEKQDGCEPPPPVEPPVNPPGPPAPPAAPHHHTGNNLPYTGQSGWLTAFEILLGGSALGSGLWLRRKAGQKLG